MLLNVFSKENGRFSLVAKGVKRKKSQPIRAILQSFSSLNIEYTGRGDLKTLCHAELSQSPNVMPSRALACGYYINELLMRSIEEWQEFLVLFDCYEKTIGLLKNNPTNDVVGFSPILRNFEMSLLSELGIAPEWRFDVDGNEIEKYSKYSFVKELGFQLIVEDEMSSNIKSADARFEGRAILSLATNNYDVETLKTCQKITQMLLRQIIGDRPLESRKLWI